MTTYDNDQHNINIVIAPRQSGKTTNLVKDALRYVLYNDSDVFIVTMNSRMNDNIRSIIHNTINNDMINYNGLLEPRIRLATIEYILPYLGNMRDNTRIYFDESDFINDIPLIKNAYYTTTPTTGVTNSFIEMLESGEYNVFGRRLASIEPAEQVEMEHIVIPTSNNNFTIGNVDDEILYLYRIGVD
jgi:hypothetical protein